MGPYQPDRRRGAVLLMSVACAVLFAVGAQAQQVGGKPPADAAWGSYSQGNLRHRLPAIDRAAAAPATESNRGTLQIFTNQVDFDNAVGNPGALSAENFDDGATAPGTVNTCTEPVGSTSNDVCFTPGQLVEGFAITSSNSGGIVVLGGGFLGPGQTSAVIGGNSFTATTIVTFDPPVVALSADIFEGVGANTVDVQVFDELGASLGSASASPAGPDASAFLGIISSTAIGRIELTGANDSGELLDNLRFGSDLGPALLINAGAATVIDQCPANPAQSNGIIEPGETVDITVPVAAVGGDFTNVEASLDLPAPAGVTYLTSTAVLGNLSAGTSADANFSIRVDGGFVCLTGFNLGLTADSDEGSATGTISIDVGASGSPVPLDVPVSIPDNNPAGADSTIDVPQSFTLSDLGVRVDIPHTWVGDLIITLTSPSNTTITLLDRPGQPATPNGCDNNDVAVTFTDGEPDPESACDAAGTNASWPVATAGPVQPLSTFNGENVQGTWTLNVSDHAGIDLGQIVDWELIPTPEFEQICSVCSGDDIIFQDGFEVPTSQ